MGVMHLKRLPVLALLACSLPSFALVTALPGSTPQMASPGQDFENEVVVRVTDANGAPAVDAFVRWNLLATGFGVDVYPLDTLGVCGIDLGWNCSRTADASGIARLGRFRAGSVDKTVRMSVSATWKSVSLGGADIIFRIGASPLPLELSMASGDRQDGTVGQFLASPIVARVLNPDGTPAVGQAVVFYPASDGIDAGFVSFSSQGAPVLPSVLTDDQGYARAPSFYAGRAVGNYTVSAFTVDPATSRHASAYSGGIIRTADGRDTASLQNMWWSGPWENGWGMSMVQHDDAMFNVLFVYDANGMPTWLVQSEPEWTRGVGSTLRGLFYVTKGAPFWAYDASRFSTVRQGGVEIGPWGEIDFKGEQLASLNLARGPQVLADKTIVPQDFTGDAPSPLTGVADMWWGGLSKNGWGIAIHEQLGNLFSVWFTYDGNGAPTWFVMPGGTWSDSRTYTGTIYRTRGSPWMGTTYDATRLSVESVGPYTLRFADRDHATLDFSVDGHAGSLALTRQPFGSDR